MPSSSLRLRRQPNPLRMGIEIECIVNNAIHSFPIGSYHGGAPMPTMIGKWEAQRDGSLHTSGKFGVKTREDEEDGSRRKQNGEFCCELVSRASENEEEFHDLMERLIKYLSKDGTLELKDVMYFNDSCGSHLHFSKGILVENKMPYEILLRTRKKFIEMMLKSNIKSKKEIIAHYGRQYAKIVRNVQRVRGTERYCNWRDVERHSEFNFHSERGGKGMEWRSPNLLNIQTWDELREAIQIYVDCIKYLYKELEDYTEEKVFKLNRKELKMISENIDKAGKEETELIPKYKSYTLVPRPTPNGEVEFFMESFEELAQEERHVIVIPTPTEERR